MKVGMEFLRGQEFVLKIIRASSGKLWKWNVQKMPGKRKQKRPQNVKTTNHKKF